MNLNSIPRKLEGKLSKYFIIFVKADSTVRLGHRISSLTYITSISEE